MKCSRYVIDGILIGAEAYCSGIKRYSRKGEVFGIPIPPILDPDIYQRYLEKREANKIYPDPRRKYHYLLGSLIRCRCGRVWVVNSTTGGNRINSEGKKVGRKKRYWYFWCTEHHKDAKHPHCARTIGVPITDRIVWEKVRDAINNPDILMGKARLHVAKLREQAESMTAEVNRIQEALDCMVMERQQIIT